MPKKSTKMSAKKLLSTDEAAIKTVNDYISDSAETNTYPWFIEDKIADIVMAHAHSDEDPIEVSAEPKLIEAEIKEYLLELYHTWARAGAYTLYIAPFAKWLHVKHITITSSVSSDIEINYLHPGISNITLSNMHLGTARISGYINGLTRINILHSSIEHLILKGKMDKLTMIEADTSSIGTIDTGLTSIRALVVGASLGAQVLLDKVNTDNLIFLQLNGLVEDAPSFSDCGRLKEIHLEFVGGYTLKALPQIHGNCETLNIKASFIILAPSDEQLGDGSGVNLSLNADTMDVRSLSDRTGITVLLLKTKGDLQYTGDISKLSLCEIDIECRSGTIVLDMDDALDDDNLDIRISRITSDPLWRPRKSTDTVTVTLPSKKTVQEALQLHYCTVTNPEVIKTYHHLTYIDIVGDLGLDELDASHMRHLSSIILNMAVSDIIYPELSDVKPSNCTSLNYVKFLGKFGKLNGKNFLTLPPLARGLKTIDFTAIDATTVTMPIESTSLENISITGKLNTLILPRTYPNLPTYLIPVGTKVKCHSPLYSEISPKS